ncbi:flagellum-adhesion glycoprotein [Trypanosoma theileri]|uniref:Flagellum-adhesion glycoprotein n=1 Tax=Trypanosoma theileri TaxID=67003 RepID=A0A1X0NRY9_9TRYP|nr:flagellum-adhesion glycoprotein [Trypanosoma theileri]ORC86880.1 flagellum-adhesion glycoprotein [Trypanosoma theileri]
MPFTFLLVFLSLLALPYGSVPAAAEEVIDDLVVYTLFASYSCPRCAQGQTDGPSGRGSIFEAKGATRGVEYGSVLVTDSGGAGSSVRLVNRSGVFTVAGSGVKRGLVNGASGQALFDRPTGIVRVGDTLYVADTGNNAVRRIAGDGTVSTFLNNQQVSSPRYILPYRRPEGTYDLFVADTARTRIIFVALTGTDVVSEYLTGFQPGLMQIGTTTRRMYATANTSYLVSINMVANNEKPTYWYIGNISCLGYSAGLMLTPDENELYYFGGVGGKKQLLALSTTATEEEAPKLCPRVVMNWTKENIVSLVSVSRHEFYAITTTNVYIIRDATYTTTPTLGNTPTETPTITLTVPITPTETIPLTPTKTFTPTLTPTISLYRAVAVAAFPTESFPINSSILMHELYAWLMRDVGIALGSLDFTALFQPPGNDVPGDVNVSQWNNLTTLHSHDGTITITEYLTAFGMASEDAQARLFASPWYWTRLFLSTVPERAPGTVLEEFCMIRCTTECVDLTYRREMCVGYKPPPACDEVCAGAIASSIVLGLTGVALVGLMIASPVNVLRAVLMVPPF